MGLAKAAELNSYPGPLHVLQLVNQLGLSDAQRTATDSLYANMREKALSIGRQIIEAERTLDRAFADGRIEPAMLRSQVNAIAILQGTRDRSSGNSSGSAVTADARAGVPLR